MLFRILLIAAAALLHSAPTSRADVATINDAAALEELLVPFNDLLPPLLESDGEQSTAITTTTTARITKRTTTPTAAIKTTPLTTTTTTTTTTSTPTTTRTTTATQFSKPTKKSYYQQQTQQINNKDLHKVDEKVGVPAKSQDIQLLTLDLLPPFESVADETSQQPQQQQEQQQEQQEQQSSNQQSVKLALPKTTKVSAVTQSKTLKQNVAKQQATKQHVANKPTPQQQPTASVFRQQQNVDSITPELLQQYADYFNKQTTRRPPRGPLPTITPFPNRIK